MPKAHMRVLTVHLLVEDGTPAEIADAMSELLSGAVVDEALVDWGYADGGGPASGPTLAVEKDAYQEGDFYAAAGLPWPTVRAGGYV